MKSNLKGKSFVSVGFDSIHYKRGWGHCETLRETDFCHSCKQFKATVQVIYVSVSSDVRGNIWQRLVLADSQEHSSACSLFSLIPSHSSKITHMQLFSKSIGQRHIGYYQEVITLSRKEGMKSHLKEVRCCSFSVLSDICARWITTYQQNSLGVEYIQYVVSSV